MKDLELIEACYQVNLAPGAWGARLAEALAELVPEAQAVMAASYQLSAVDGGRFLQISGDRRFVDAADEQRSTLPYMAALNRSAQRRAFLQESFGVGSPTLVSVAEITPTHQEVLRSTMPWRDLQMLGLFATLDGRNGICLAPGGEEPMRLSRRRRAQLTRLCEHLAVGYWLRELRGSAAESMEAAAAAVLTSDGKLLHRAPGTSTNALDRHLVDAVRSMDRARCRHQKRSPQEATQLWQALVAGQYTLVEQLERNGRRVILAVRCRAPHPVLTAREVAVARSAARGMANKQIAAQLGIATSTVGVHLSAAMRKLRLPGRRALASWF